MPEVDDEDALYGLDPSEFVAARNGLVRRLKAEGDKERAAATAALKRPPRSAWALNVAAREDPAAVERFLRSAAALGEALGEGGDALRDAQSRYRRALDSTVDAAATRSGADTDALRERMRSTLAAAANDEELAAALRAGVLRADHDAPGFSLGAGWAAGLADSEPRPRPAADRSRAPARAVGGSRAAREPAAPGTEPPRERAGAARRAAKAAKAAEAAAEERRAAIRRRRQLERQLDALRRRVERLARTASEAEDRALVARRDADAAAGELAEVERQLDDLGDGTSTE